jgi:hypothetical protein
VEGGGHVAYLHTSDPKAFKRTVSTFAWPDLNESPEGAPVAVGTNLSLAQTTVLDSVGPNGHEQTLATTIFLGNVTGRVTAPGAPMKIIPIQAAALGGLADLLARGYQENSYPEIIIHYMPQTTTVTPGSFIMTYFNDPAQYVSDSSALGNPGLQDITATNNSVVTSVWRPCTFKPVIQAAQKNLMIADGADARLECQGLFVLAGVSGIEPGLTYGSLFGEFRVRYKAPRLTRDLTFPSEGLLTMSWVGYVATGGEPIILNSVGVSPVWSRDGALGGSIGGQEPSTVYCGSIISMTGASSINYYYSDRGQDRSLAVGMPIYLKAARVTLAGVDQMTLTLFATYESSVEDGSESTLTGESSPFQFTWAANGVITTEVVCDVRSVILETDD